MEYLPFGETLVDEHNNSHNTPFKFNGKEFDEETGNYYYSARYYDPKMSIFISVDPLAEQTGDTYGYVYNNPINLVDPTGMKGDDWYIDAQTGKVLGQDGAATNEFRVVFKSDWDEKVSVNGGSKSEQATKDLQSVSGKITVNSTKIAKDINTINNQTIADQTKERQVYIGLLVDTSTDYPTAEVTSAIGPAGVSGLTEPEIHETTDGEGNLTSRRFAGTRLRPLAQIHSHNTAPKGKKNVAQTSDSATTFGPFNDKSTAAGFGITIYAIDSWTKITPGGNAIHRVNARGKASTNVGTTEAHDIGNDALREYVGN
ncbi:RHS repeat-associated core domain-containing protein [Flavobacterium litorale]|uniref:RHS repeat-associated core domain-containing protein n=1 Tax=Flavobacterium litorale TaxID=2856519 RepID=A0ABX8VB30_9FLAO|nr:RHS repeat-associated core domain-containing protein [Flavobacterium litorale]QYJ68241.1 RHS repeat-associated core domain-containing protein [Flavobacterium litorale]